MTGKHRITVNLDDAEYQALQQMAEGAERSLAWLGRKAICDLIRNTQISSGFSAGAVPQKQEPSRRSA